MGDGRPMISGRPGCLSDFFAFSISGPSRKKRNTAPPPFCQEVSEFSERTVRLSISPFSLGANISLFLECAENKKAENEKDDKGVR